MIDIYKVARALVEFFEEDEKDRGFVPTPEWDKLTEGERTAYSFVLALNGCSEQNIKYCYALLRGLLNENHHG